MLNLSLGAKEAEDFNAFIMPLPIHFIGYKAFRLYLNSLTAVEISILNCKTEIGLCGGRNLLWGS